MRESLRIPRVERGGCKQLQDCLNSSVAAPGESEACRNEATHQAPWLLGPIQAEKEPRCHVLRQGFVLQLRPSPHQRCQEPAWEGVGVSWDRVATQGAGLCWTRKAGRRLPSGDKDAGGSWSGKDGGCGQGHVKGKP